jgi:folate-dependent tRNA-U54 methylase TrmFO/GidA
MQPLEKAPKGKKQRNEALSARALADLQAWIHDRTSLTLPAVSRS